MKASTESHADVGDRANEAIRVDADQLRCRVVAEGGNLGLTQAARVEYSLGGGRCYTDAIDNSAGVDCSDHEVNIKILLGGAMAAGELEADARDPLLAEVTDEVASLVLADNAAQANALEIASLEAVDLLGVHARQIERLERDAVLDRALERLPDAKRLQERAAMSRGLTPAELAVLLAFTKIDLQRQLLASDVPDDEYFAGDLVEYFPEPFRQRFATVARAHPLRREIVATVVANAVVNRAGISFLSRLADEIGAPLPALTCAHVIARDVYDARTMWSAIDALDLAVPAATQGRMFLAVRRLVERAARWFARRDELLPIGATVSRYREPVALVVATLADLVEGAAATALAAATDALVGDGVPAPLARQVAGCEAALGAVTIAELAPTSATPVETVAAIHFSLAARLRLDWLRELVAALPRADRWQTEARAALRDDLTDCHRGLDHAVITTGLAAVASPDAAPRDAGRRAVDGWLDRHRADVDRYERVLDEIHASGAFGLAQLTAARRALRELSESPGSGGPTA